MERHLHGGFGACTRVLVAVLFLCTVCSFPATLAQSGNLNIDCGASERYTDSVTGVTWDPDTPYISTGTVKTFTTLPSSLQDFTEMMTLRYFDGPQAKNCYTLPVTNGIAYLLKLTFYYGNYDNANRAPVFELAVDATITANVTGEASYEEFHYTAVGNVTYLCLMRTPPGGGGSPYISGISLRTATDLSDGYADQYDEFIQDGIIMKTRTRVNFGGLSFLRAPDDYYDRFWFAEGPTSSYYLNPTYSTTQFVSTASKFKGLVQSTSSPPSAVMQTAVTIASRFGILRTYLLPEGQPAVEASVFVSFYYAELNSSALRPVRNFTIEIPTLTQSDPVIDMSSFPFLDYSSWNFFPKTTRMPNSTTAVLTPQLSATAGPMLTALEVFEQSGPRVAKTTDRDALAVEGIKKSLNLTDWSGDPCLPAPHSWITCTGDNPVITAVNLSGYQLGGLFPASFEDLLDLTSLDLSNNHLSGPLPQWLPSMRALRVLAVQNNNFSGAIPQGLTNSQLLFTYSGNPLLGDQLAPGPSGGPSREPVCGNCNKSNIGLVVGASAGGVVALIILAGLAIFAYRRCHRQRTPPDVEQRMGPKIAPPGGASAYTFAEVATATAQFKRELGRGGFGPVYYGKLPDGHEVAVKVADGTSRQGEREFFNEVDVLSRVHHKNLVALLGYCQDEKQVLIYEYMPGGSLFDHLHGSSVSSGPLDWRQRLNIAVNAAQGLEYLHTACSPSFIHRDVKSSNILLTPTYEGKVADFGLTKLIGESDDTRVMTKVMGTAGYLDPEYYSSQYISPKSDVYSFGMVLLELITGSLPIVHRAPEGRDPNLGEWVRENLMKNDMDAILDRAMAASNPNMDAVWKVAEIAMRSVEPKGEHRPTMSEVVQELQGARTIEMSTMPSTQAPPPLHSRLPSAFSDYSSGSYGPTSYPSAR